MGIVQVPGLTIALELLDQNSRTNTEVNDACVGLQRIPRQQPTLV